MTHKSSSPLPEGLSSHAKSRSSTFVSKLRQAMSTIEAEIEQNEGLYPFNAGRLTKAELCRRAGVDDQTLQNPTHKTTTNKMVDEWLERVKHNVAQGRTVVRRTVTERADHWKQEHERIANAYLLAELEHNERLLEIMQLKAELARLERENAELRDMIATGKLANIVPIRQKGE